MAPGPSLCLVASSGWYSSLTPPSVSFSVGSTGSLHLRTHVTGLNPPPHSMIIFPSQDSNLSHTCRVLSVTSGSICRFQNDGRESAGERHSACTSSQLCPHSVAAIQDPDCSERLPMKLWLQEQGWKSFDSAAGVRVHPVSEVARGLRPAGDLAWLSRGLHRA